MTYFVYTIHILACIFLILVVLLQQGKGADLSVFGGGSTQAAFGARGAATLFHKLTVAFFVLFIITTMSIAFIQNSGGSSSVMSGVEAPAAAAAEDATEGEAALSAGDDGATTDGSLSATEETLDTAGDAPAEDAVEPASGDAGDGGSGEGDTSQ